MWRNLLLLPLLACLLAAAPPVPGPKGAVKPQAKRGYLGVQIAAVNEELVIRMVIAGAPAANAGLRPGDVLVRIHGIKPANLQTAVRVIGSLKPGQKVKLLVRRNGRERELQVTMGEL